MRKPWNRALFRFDGATFLFAALLILVLPLKWLCAAIIAAAWHELCHWLAIKMMGGRLLRVSVGSSGTVMEAEVMAPWKKLVCSLAGPLGGLLLLMLLRWFPRIAVCATVQSVYNLLPLRPLDGGQVLRCCTAIFLHPLKAQKICVTVEHALKAGIVAAALCCTFFLKLGYIPVLIAATLLFKTKSEKSLEN